MQNSDPASKHYDYIIIGAGLSGLSLAMSLKDYLDETNKQLLIIDKSFENYTARTWSFWGLENGPFDHLVHHSWNKIRFFHQQQELVKSLGKYQYKSISSNSFRAVAFSALQSHAHVTFLEERIERIEETDDVQVLVTGTNIKYTADFVFDSRFDRKRLDDYKGIKLWQQFKGWTVETKASIFDSEIADIMDFRVSQQDSVAFFYVLPQSDKKALVEYTLFTVNLKDEDYFEHMLQKYMDKKAGVSNYIISATEKGVIPMTDYTFRQSSKRIIPIGTAGGCSKSSSGYTFTFVQKQTEAIMRAIQKGNNPKIESNSRFSFYDQVLLAILARYPERGASIFFRLFDANNEERVIRFLDNDTRFLEELAIFSSLPIGLFSKTAIRIVLKK